MDALVLRQRHVSWRRAVQPSRWRRSARWPPTTPPSAGSSRWTEHDPTRPRGRNRRPSGSTKHARSAGDAAPRSPAARVEDRQILDRRRARSTAIVSRRAAPASRARKRASAATSTLGRRRARSYGVSGAAPSPYSGSGKQVRHRESVRPANAEVQRRRPTDGARRAAPQRRHPPASHQDADAPVRNYVGVAVGRTGRHRRHSPQGLAHPEELCLL
jgi:hypothetical protein